MVVVNALQLESAELEREQQRIELQKLAAEAEASERCLREEMEEKVLIIFILICVYAAFMAKNRLYLCYYFLHVIFLPF